MIGIPGLEEKIKDLPQDIQGEVNDFVDFLLEKHGRKAKGELNQNDYRPYRHCSKVFRGRDKKPKAMTKISTAYFFLSSVLFLLFAYCSLFSSAFAPSASVPGSYNTLRYR